MAADSALTVDGDTRDPHRVLAPLRNGLVIDLTAAPIRTRGLSISNDKSFFANPLPRERAASFRRRLTGDHRIFANSRCGFIW